MADKLQSKLINENTVHIWLNTNKELIIFYLNGTYRLYPKDVNTLWWCIDELTGHLLFKVNKHRPWEPFFGHNPDDIKVATEIAELLLIAKAEVDKIDKILLTETDSKTIS